MKKYDVIVLGAGAAGLIAAATASKKGRKVLLIEKKDKVGSKLLITGKGRCNITNANSMSQHLKHVRKNPRFLKYAYSKFFNNDICQLLHNLGVKTVVEQGNRVFPVSQKAVDVVNALLKLNKQFGVDIINNCRAHKLLIERQSVMGIEVIRGQGLETYLAHNVIVCTGGRTYPATGSTGDGYSIAEKAGHKIVRTMPALVPVETIEDTPKLMQGLQLKNTNVSLWVNNKKYRQEFGELLFTHFGLSGPTILTLSRNIVEQLKDGNTVHIIIDLKPALDDVKLDKKLLRDLETNSKKQIKHIFKLWLPSSMIPVFLNLLDIDSSTLGHQVRAETRKKIRLLMKNMTFQIKKHRPYSEAVITSGGVDCSEVDPKTMQSKIVKGLYFAGEVLDLDADTGGYNLQIAWSTAWIAGASICN